MNKPASNAGIPHFSAKLLSHVDAQVGIRYKVYFENIAYAEAIEDLAWWESSEGKHLDACRVRVQAKSLGNSVDVLIIPY